MRRLWSDIDRARDRLGLGPERERAATGYDLAALLAYAGAAAAGAAAWVGTLAELVPASLQPPCDVLACLGEVPLIGTLVRRWSGAASD